MALSAGDRLGPYEIREPLGAGGMGEVYRAHDTKLDRDVALKVLPDGALGDEEARRRFQKEANALSRLSHPHIATIFDFDSANGTDFLAMELVRGPSLRDELEDKGALSERDVLRLGAQLARALQAAHEQGIIHRDLKPANLQLTPDGLLKVLDFGLARLLPKATLPGEETAPTQTAVGRVAGTLLYMSPEQLRGRGVDARTDLYAAGAVLYEMATGRRLFSKPSSAELTDAILHEEPTAPRELNERISPGLEAVILKALDKDPELRHQTARDLLVDLERLQLRPDSRSSGSGSRRGGLTDSEKAPANVRTAPGTRLWLWVAASVVLVAAGLAWLGRPNPLPKITTIQPLLWDMRVLGSIRTDGRHVYQLVTKNDQTILQRVPISGGDPVETLLPFAGVVALLDILPGEAGLLVTASHNDPTARDALPDRPVWRLPLPDGVPERFGDLVARQADVSQDGQSLAVIRGRSLLSASIDGSNQRELFESDHRLDWARWSPDGKRLRFTQRGPDEHEDDWIWEIPATGGRPRPLWPGHLGDWTADGRYFVFDRPPGHDLFVAAERPWTRWWPGTPAQLTSGIGAFTFWGSSLEGNNLVVSQGAAGSTAKGTLVRFNPERELFEPTLQGESALDVVPSPDGEWIAWVRVPEGTLWRSRPDGSDRLQLTHPPSLARTPQWSPDGTRLVFASRPSPSSHYEIRIVAADGSWSEMIARPESPDEDYWDACWLPDDTIILSREARRGLLLYDPTNRSLAPVPGGEELQWPKCSVQGDVWATPRHLRRRGTMEWQVLDAPDIGWAHWTRDGGAICGSVGTDTKRIGCLDVENGRVTDIIDLSTVEFGIGGGNWVGFDAERRPLVLRSDKTATVHVVYWEAP